MHLIFKHSKDKKAGGWSTLIPVVSLSYIGYYTAKTMWMPLSIQSGMTALLFMYIGYAARQSELFIKWNAPVCARIGMLLTWIYCTQNCGKFYMVGNTFTDGFMDIIGAVCGSYCVVEFCRLWEKYVKVGVRFVAFIGRHTLPILCVHILELNLLNYWAHILPFVTSLGISLNWYLVLISRLSVVFAGVFTLSLIPYINKIYAINIYSCFKSK